eukprot:CAMPEP_0177527036 /NCGR_PEP_ID=MMETSP0369-20130122/51407_1 /TAXON_ID=447022 ORGANISM="Scrippsiella hangoei-like, Strain SHHI-4" /NCGR_SAMPLE_ID=MMETSP0369 /ASSEMBLY_ACC=CAM_ASM_000364 /LENGTH=171 /DNA_ID=CAMNT_0019007309 /DNA_START=73 /DNA_END=589 /DNA_ORIENTATION=+
MTTSSICKNQLGDTQNSSVPNAANATVGNRAQVDDASLRVDLPSLNNTRQCGEQAIAGGSSIASPPRKGTLGVEHSEAQVVRQDGTQDAGAKRQGQAVREEVADAKGTRQVRGLSEHHDVRGRRGGQQDEGEGGRNGGGQQESQGVDHSDVGNGAGDGVAQNDIQPRVCEA